MRTCARALHRGREDRLHREQLIDAQQVMQPGTILVFLEPLYEDVTPGSSCIANAYSSNHDLIASGNVGAVRSLALHAVDAAGWCMR